MNDTTSWLIAYTVLVWCCGPVCWIWEARFSFNELMVLVLLMPAWGPFFCAYWLFTHAPKALMGIISKLLPPVR